MSHQSRGAIILDTTPEIGKISNSILERQGPSTLMEYVLDSVWTVADHIYVIFRSEPNLELIESIAPFGVKVMVYKNGSSTVSALTSGLKATQSEHVFVVPSNIPFIKPNVVFALFEAARDHDAAIPRWKDGKLEPLTSVYTKKAFLKVTSNDPSHMELPSLIDNLYAVRFVDIEDELKPLDPDLYSFFGVKTQRDLSKARKIASLSQRRH